MYIPCSCIVEPWAYYYRAVSELEPTLQDRERRLIEYRLGAPYTEDMVVTLSFVGEQQQRMSVNDIRGLAVDKLAQLHKVSIILRHWSLKVLLLSGVHAA